MSKICRTCLQYTNETFKTSQSIGNLGDDTLRISVLLRFCIPELYLGLSSNPEICTTCKDNLKVSYLFKKRCLNTENIIGTFLKNVRCTGRSVELHDVLAYFSDQSKTQEEGTINIPNLENASVELNDISEQENRENPLVLDVRQSAPNPTNEGSTGNYASSELSTADRFRYKLLSAVQKSLKQNRNAIVVRKDPAQERVQKEKMQQQEFKNALKNNMCKISSVFSLHDTAENGVENNFEDEGVNNNNENKATETASKIKDEPQDIEFTDAQIDANCLTPDEDTLDASETASFQNSYSPNLQELIDGIPEVNHPDQYVDVPDFVTINNFGFKELEELRLQQRLNEETNFNAASEHLPLISNSVPVNGTDKTLPILTGIPDVLIFNGQRLVKRGDTYVMEEEQPPVSEELEEAVGEAAKAGTPSTPVRKRNRKKFKIVPVGEQPSEKKMKLNDGTAAAPKSAKADDRDVVLLFTNYTPQGVYINDHDYLISPYKRNKVLIEEDSQWICMCYICNTRHHVHKHVEHMTTHGTQCRVCSTDFGTPFMYNIHFKAHKKPCRYCTQVLPYSQIKSHEEQHIAEEKMYEDTTRRRVYSVRRGKRRVKKDEKSVYFPLPRQSASDAEKPEESCSKEASKSDVETGNVSSEDTDAAKAPAREKQRRRTKGEDATGEVATPRTLRRRVKKWYAESDDDDNCHKGGGPSGSGGTLLDIKQEDKSDSCTDNL